MTTGFKFTHSGGTVSDFDEMFVRKEFFINSGLWLWGNNSNGGLGDETTVHKSSPVQTVTGGTDWKRVSCGDSFTAGIKTDGTLWTWGRNDHGQLGDGTVGLATYKSSPIQTICGGTDWQSVSCGTGHVVATKTDGTLWTWGSNYDGQLGDNTITRKSSPVQTVAGGTDWQSVSCGYMGVAAIKTDGTLWLWGWNADGQLGDNTVVSRSSPVQTVAGGTNWLQVEPGRRHCGAIKTDGTLWTWGAGVNGALGDNTTVNKSSPVQTVAGGTNWKQFAGGQWFSSAIKTDGTLWTWGQNTYGQLGDNTIDKKSSPIQTIAGGNSWKQVTCGYTHVVAVKTDGTLWSWGRDLYGALGDGTTVNKSSPVQTIAGGNNWSHTESHHYHTMAITIE